MITGAHVVILSTDPEADRAEMMEKGTQRPLGREGLGPESFGLRFKLVEPHEVDEGLEALICEAYRVGQQKHLEKQ